MPENWQVGDVVQLKSGGPPMTVDQALDNGIFICKWFTREKVEKARFPAEALEKAE